jgi:dienelactone hydrolase
MTAARWERRFRAPELSFPDWSPLAPERVVYTSTESGVWQAHALDLATGVRRQVSDHPVGIIDGRVTNDGGSAIWWQDETGDESGRWRVQGFRGGEIHDLLPGAPLGWNQGLAQAPQVVAAGISNRNGFAVFVVQAEGEAREIHRSAEFAGVSRDGLSADGRLLAVVHSEHGDMLHPALRVVDPLTGDALGEQRDIGKSIEAVGWSPVPGDDRLALVHERPGEDAPAIWDLGSGEWLDVETGLEGPVRILGWWPDASALLLRHEHEARHRLYQFDLASQDLVAIAHPEGTIAGARVRPDGRVWLVHSSGAAGATLLDDTGATVLALDGKAAPPGRPYISCRYDNMHGQSVHGFYVTPEGDGPWPILVRPHGGPTWLDEDRFSPEVQSYVDAGMAVAMINYRGSTGYGATWRDSLIGDIGGPELEDLNAGLAHLTDIGVADPERAAVGGWSWGGYLTLMELGKHPGLWRCGVAGVPVGDYALGYEELSPELQAYDRALLGGEPKDVPELMLDRSPINFADNVCAPVLFLIGENDSRCPFRQAIAYVERIRARGHPHELYVFATGHGSFDVEEEIRQQRVILAFLAQHVPGVTVPEA